MENTKDYNFFYLMEKEINKPLKIIITSSLGEGKYTEKEMDEEIEKINLKNTKSLLVLYKDDGENFWNITSNNGEKLDIGSKESNYEKWDEIRSKVLPIEKEDLIIFCSSGSKENTKIKTLKK